MEQLFYSECVSSMTTPGVKNNTNQTVLTVLRLGCGRDLEMATLQKQLRRWVLGCLLRSDEAYGDAEIVP